MLTKIKSGAIALMGILSAILFALFQREKANRSEDKLKTAEAVRKQQSSSNKAAMDGLNNEAKTRNEKIDTSRRDHFSK